MGIKRRYYDDYDNDSDASIQELNNEESTEESDSNDDSDSFSACEVPVKRIKKGPGKLK